MPKRTQYPRLRVHVRKGKGGQVWSSWYYDGRPDGLPDEPLGGDYTEALKRWDEIHNHRPRMVGTLMEAFTRWRAEVLPTYESAETRKGYSRNLKKIEPSFGVATWDQVTPKSITDYLKKRSAKTQGNREMALLSVIWAWAVREELVSKPFPLLGNRGWKNKENPRELGVSDALFAALYSSAGPMLRDCMDLATATGMRLTDCRTVLMPSGDVLSLRSSKTGKAATFDVCASPTLLALVARRKSINSAHLMLLSTPSGKPVSARMLRDSFEAARSAAAMRPENGSIKSEIESMYLRDLRKRAAALAEDLEAASKLLQHSSKAVTEKHYRRGDKLRPVR